MKLVFSVLAVVCLAASPAWAQSDRSANSETQIILPEPAMLGAHFAKGVHPARPARPGKSPNLVYHNGDVMTDGAVVRMIFWGTSWNSAPGDKISGLNAFYDGVGGSHYLDTNGEYHDGSGFVQDSVTSDTGYIDPTAAPTRAPATSAILAEVCKAVGTDVVANGYYPVYIDNKRGHAGYCAWHSWGTCPGSNVEFQFAFFFNLDNDAGCNPQSPGAGSQGLKALANVSGHELSEALTDPHGDGWYDSNGAENADKCAWKFGQNLLVFGGRGWKIQGNWSNDAYDHNQGYGGNRGCIDGTN